MYPEKFFDIYIYEQMFFQILVTKGDTSQFFFWKIIAWETSKFPCGRGFHILIQKCVSEEWEQIYQFSLSSKTTKQSNYHKFFLNVLWIIFCYFFIFLIYET